MSKFWETKYVAKEITTPSLDGAYTSYYDKFGALLYQKNTLGQSIRMYENEKEYKQAIKQN